MSKGIRWALRAPRPAPEGFTLWTPTGEITLLGREEYIRQSIWGYGSLWLLAQESPGKSQGKARFPLGLFPGFTRTLCVRSGGFQPPGQKHNVESLPVSLKFQRKQSQFGLTGCFRCRSPEDEVLWCRCTRDEPPMTACGGFLIGGEITRNEQCPHEADLRLLSVRIAEALASSFRY